jgi:serine/threonine protein kinase
MSLAAGTRLGPYEIQAAIGAGGMGEVYKARDTRLDRTVAIKILPAELSTDPERRARFEREAKTIAGLTHPHICTLFDVGEHDGSTFLVMEHLQGETLASRLEKGRLPLDQALTLATEVAEALAAAHRQGIIHRDLKPGNVMLTKAGAKLLDFGLAKLKGHGAEPAAGHLASMPTQSPPLTAEGTIVGTLQYMAPEQVEGNSADARTDLWALGAILYEMVTGKRAFEGASAASLIGNIMNTEPPALASLQPLTPPAVDRLVRQCLAKAPDDRPDTAHDVANYLRGLRETSGVGVPTGVRPPRRLHSPASPVRLSLDVRPAEELNSGGQDSTRSTWVPTLGGSHTSVAWTPDGQALVFVGRRAGTQQLYVRALDRDDARPLAGTEDAQVPSVSPDGRWVAFWAGEALKKVPLAGGVVVEVSRCPHAPPWGLSWDARGSLYFAKLDGCIWKISADGELAAVTTPGETEWAHILPWLLPGDQTLLYTVRKRQWSWGDEEVVAQTLTTGARKILLHDAADARYVATGHLVFLRRGVFFAVTFDLEQLEVRGTPVALIDGVAQALTGDDTDDITGAGQFAIAPTGTLAWVRSPLVPYRDRILVSVDRRGHVTPLAAPVRSYSPKIRLAPGGRQFTVAVRSLSEVSVWTGDLARGTLAPVARGGEAYAPIWTPDGERLVFGWVKNGRRSLAWQRADGTAPPEVLVSELLAPGALGPSSWTPDSRELALALGDTRVVAIATIENGQATVRPLAQMPEMVQWPEFSPDGPWLAYGSNVSGRYEVYVQTYPGPGSRMQVSIDGGSHPAWDPNGRELFFLSPRDAAGKRRMMVASFEPGTADPVGLAQPLFELADSELWSVGGPVRAYEVAPDGQRFFVVQDRPAQLLPPVTHIDIVLNWFEELKAKVPTTR